MQVELTRPELERYIAEQVEAGHFPSAQAAIEAAIEQMMLTGKQFELTDEDVEAINEAEDQIDRGEFVDFDTFAAEMRKRHASH
jgi:Arc/MetJ-type ribon-helix-helix transcriptional regulator